MKVKFSESTIVDTDIVMFEAIFDEIIESRYINSIRRVLLDNEIPTKCLTVAEEDIITEDPYFIHDYFIKNLETAPVMQNIPMDLKFSLSAKNETELPITIYTQDIMAKSGALCPKYSDGLMILSDLGSKYTLEVSNIKVDLRRECARQSLAHQVFAGTDHITGKSTLRFGTMGTMKPKDITKAAIKVIMNKLSSVRERIDAMVIGIPDTEGIVECIWIIPGETSTVGELINIAIQELYNKNIYITVIHLDEEDSLKIRLHITNGINPREAILAALEHINGFYSEFLELL